jgi:hypothetical protein
VRCITGIISGRNEGALETATTALRIRGIFHIWSGDVPYHNRVACFSGNEAGFVMHLNPEARVAFQSFGSWSILLMLTVGIGCALTAIGLWRGTLWGIRLGLAILVVNILGDLVNVIARHDYRSLIGLPIAGVMIFYLARSATIRRTQ